MQENIVEKLTVKDDKYACAFADKIISESQETDEWYQYFDDFATQEAFIPNFKVASEFYKAAEETGCELFKGQ